MQKDKIQTYITDVLHAKTTDSWWDLNYIKIPTTVITASLENTELYNNLYKLLLKNKSYKKIKRTKSGGISIDTSCKFNFNQYDVRQLGNCNEITICTLEMSARIQFRTNNYKDTNTGEEKLVSATQFYNKHWLPLCRKYNINMSDYYCSYQEGYEEKKLIHKADIKIYDGPAALQCTLYNVHHLDFHKFYPSGLIEACPEFKPVVEEINNKINYYKSIDDKLNANYYKTGLDSLIGLWQSETFKFKLAKLSRKAINKAYEKFDKVKELLADKVIATNTDGIWYQGDVYHGLYEGDSLGCWSNDHLDCKIRFKSAGSYEFIEDGKYTPVVRGATRLDRVLNRAEWEWGDIFMNTAKINKWSFKEGEGIIWVEE